MFLRNNNALAESGSFMSPNRTRDITDAIYAFALTLLVVTIDIPKFGQLVTNEEFNLQLIELLPQILVYALSFLLLAIFWITNHKEYNLLKKVDNWFLWLNFLSLIFIIFIPFTTDLMGEYPRFQLAGVIFDANILALGLVYYAIWSYAEKKGFLGGHFNPLIQKELRRRLLIVPALALAAIGLSFFFTGYSNLVCLSAPIVMWIIDVRYDKELKEAESITPEQNKN